MANMSFNFNKIQRSFMTVRLKDSEDGNDGKTLVVKMPKKATFEKITAATGADMAEMTSSDAFDTMAAIMAEVLSNNMQDERISAEYIAENYDIEEISAFVDCFMDFVNGNTKGNPN